MSAILPQRVTTGVSCIVLATILYGCNNIAPSAQVHSNRKVDDLVEQLADSSCEVRKDAAQQLAHLGSAATPGVPKLVNLLGDRDQTVVIVALEALGEIGPTAAPAIPAVISAMKSSYIPTIKAGEEALKKLHPKGAEILKIQLRHELEAALEASSVGMGDLARLLQAMALYPDKDYVPALLRCVEHDWPATLEQQRWHAIPELIWRNLAEFDDKRIAVLAMQVAASPDLQIHPATDIFRALRRNSKYLTRKGVHSILASPRLKNSSFTYVNNLGWQATLVLAEVAEKEDVPLVIEMLATYWPHRSSDDRGHVRELILRQPDEAMPALRKALALGQKPGDFKPWAHEFSIGLVPGALPFIALLLAEMKDTQAVPLFEYFGNTNLVPVDDTLKTIMPECLATIDSPAALQALRRIAPNGMVQRVKLGDPVAVDWALAEAGRIRRPDANGICWDDNGQSDRWFGLVRSLGCPRQQDVTKWWHASKPTFETRFMEKYGLATERPLATERTEPTNAPYSTPAAGSQR